MNDVHANSNIRRKKEKGKGKKEKGKRKKQNTGARRQNSECEPTTQKTIT